MRRELYRRLAFGVGVLAVLALLGAVAPVLAGEAMSPDSFREYDVGDGTVTLDVQDALFGQVVADLIQPRTRVNIVVSPEAASEKVTLRVVDLHWVQALQALVERIGGVIIRSGPNYLRIERPLPVSFKFTDTDVREVIMTIADYAKANVILAEDVKGTITLTLNNTPWRAALEEVVRTAGYALVEEDYGMLRVLPVNRLDLEQGTYRFRYLRPPPPYKGVITGQSSTGGSGSAGGSGGGGGGGGSGDIIKNNVTVPSDNPADIEDNFPVLAALRQIVSPENGDVKYIASENAIVYQGTRPKIDALRRLLTELDVEPPQVFIDMNFIITTNNDALNLGLQGGTGVGVGFSGSDIIHMLPFNLGGGGGDVADAITGTAFPSPAGASFNYGTLNFSQTQLLMQLLQQDTSTQIVQAPKILALDNQEATIFIGESVRYARTTAATNQNGGLQFAVEEDPNSPVNVGFQLLVIPNVIRGEKKIMMTVIPQRRALNGTTSPIIGFDRIEMSGQTIDLPRVQSATLKTAMILRDGETAVIGGLLEDSDRDSVEKVPLFGDVPILGMLFQGKNRTKTKQHLLITITPRILQGSDATNCTITEELMGRQQAVGTEWSDLRGDAVRNFPLEPCAPPAPPPCQPAGAAPVAPPTPPPPAMRMAPAR